VAAVRAVLKIDSQFQTLGRFSFFRHSHSQHPAAISSTFLFSLFFFAPLRGKSFLASEPSALLLWPQKSTKFTKIRILVFQFSAFQFSPPYHYKLLACHAGAAQRVDDFRSSRLLKLKQSISALFS
jgi:hypothetical protein